MSRALLHLAAIAAVSLSICPQAQAERARTRTVVTRAPAIDPEALAPLLARGELALVESHDDGTARQVVIFSSIAAPPERVYDVIADVEKYPAFMPSVVHSKIVKRQGPMVAYEWELDVPVFNLKGTRAMRGARPTLIETRGVAGNFKESRERTELYGIEGGKRTLAVFYRAIDVGSAGMILKTMVELEPSMEHGVNLASGFVHLRDVRRRAEGTALPPSGSTAQGPVPRFARLELPERTRAAVRKLIAFGPLAIIESNTDGTLKQCVLLADVAASKEQLAKIIHQPGRYPEFLPNIAEQKVVDAGGGKLKLAYELDVPLANLEGESLMEIEASGDVEVVATGGDITRGRWRWELTALGPDRSMPIHYAYSDVRETSFFVRKLIEKQPLFEHGIVVAASTVAIMGMKARAEGKR